MINKLKRFFKSKERPLTLYLKEATLTSTGKPEVMEITGIYNCGNPMMVSNLTRQVEKVTLTTLGKYYKITTLTGKVVYLVPANELYYDVENSKEL